MANDEFLAELAKLKPMTDLVRSNPNHDECYAYHRTTLMALKTKETLEEENSAPSRGERRGYDSYFWVNAHLPRYTVENEELHWACTLKGANCPYIGITGCHYNPAEFGFG